MDKNPFAMITKGSGEDKKPPKHLKRISHERTHDGKIVHTHHHHHPEHHPDETHVSNDMSDLHDHVENHMGAPNPGEDASEHAPMTAEPPQMPAPAGGPEPGM